MFSQFLSNINDINRYTIYSTISEKGFKRGMGLCGVRMHQKSQQVAQKNCFPLYLSSVLIQKNQDLTNNAFEQIEILLTNTDHFIDAQPFKYQNMQ